MSRFAKTRLVKDLSTDDRYAAGKALRKACPRESHAAWKATDLSKSSAIGR